MRSETFGLYLEEDIPEGHLAVDKQLMDGKVYYLAICVKFINTLPSMIRTM